MLVTRHPLVYPRTRGFTLLEMLTTIAVLAVLVGLALPSFRQFVANQRVRNVSFDLMASLLRTRSEAIAHNANISLAKKVTSGNWDRGWKVTDSASNTLLDQEAYKGISITDSATLGAVTYGKDGRAVSATTSFTIAPSTAVDGVSSRCIKIGLSGVPSSSVGACQ